MRMACVHTKKGMKRIFEFWVKPRVSKIRPIEQEPISDARGPS